MLAKEALAEIDNWLLFSNAWPIKGLHSKFQIEIEIDIINWNLLQKNRSTEGVNALIFILKGWMRWSSSQILKTMASTSYDAQLQIRRDAEEHSVAHHNLGSWMDQMKSKSIGSNTTIEKNKHHAAAKKNGGRACSSKSMPSKDLKETSTDNSSCEGKRVQVNNYFAHGRYKNAI